MDDKRLRKYFKFTENDLSANRKGEFSPEQKKQISFTIKAQKKSSRESAVILFIIASVGMGLGLGLGSIAPQGIGRYGILALLAVVWPVAWGGRGIRALLDASALKEPVLRSVSGRVHLVRHSSEEHVMQLGDMEFDLDDNPSGVIIEGDKLAIYYLEATEEILSVTYI